MSYLNYFIFALTSRIRMLAVSHIMENSQGRASMLIAAWTLGDEKQNKVFNNSNSEHVSNSMSLVLVLI